MKPVLVIDAVGLSRRQITEDTPNLRSLAARGAWSPMGAVFPAVTCTAQATFLTGRQPAGHGVVGNGWYQYVGGEGSVISMDGYGESAPAPELFAKFGFTTERVTDTVRELLAAG